MCYHVNKGNIFGSCLILVGVLALFLLGKSQCNDNGAPGVPDALVAVWAEQPPYWYYSCSPLTRASWCAHTALGTTRMKLTPMAGIGYLVTYVVFIVYLCLSTIDESWRLPF